MCLKKSKQYRNWLAMLGQTDRDSLYEGYRLDLCLRLLFLGFHDYIAARRLLLDPSIIYHLTGFVLASSALEKYLKAILAGANIDFMKIHLDKLDDFKAQLKLAGPVGQMVLTKIDSQFIQLMADTYKFRYLDETRLCDGAPILQVVGELDYAVSLIEGLIKRPGYYNPYEESVLDKTHPIHDQNYVLNGLDKKAFMEQNSPFYAVKAAGKNGIIITMKGPFTFTYDDGHIVNC